MLGFILKMLRRAYYTGLPFVTASFCVHRYPFKTAMIQAKRTTAGTTTIITVDDDESILITDMVFTSDKKNACTVVVCFSDGNNTFNPIDINVTDSAPAISFSPQGYFKGWLGADVQLITAGGAFTASVSVWYIRMSKAKSLTYNQWIESR